MNNNVSEVPVTREKHAVTSSALQPLEALHRKIDRLFSEFGWGSSSREPLWWHAVPWGASAPAVDIVESEKGYEITAELPGMDEKNIEVKVGNGHLTIKGEKQEEKEEKEKNYYLHERHFGSFERSFELPDGADTGKIEAAFKKGVLTVTVPKKSESQKPAKKIEVKAG